MKVKLIIWGIAIVFILFAFLIAAKYIILWYNSQKYWRLALIKANEYHCKVIEIQNKIDNGQAAEYDSIIYFLNKEYACLDIALEKLASYIINKIIFSEKIFDLIRNKNRISLVLKNYSNCLEELVLMSLCNKFTSASSEILDLAISITQGCESESDKAKRICNFVARNIKYQKKPFKPKNEYLSDSTILHPNEILRRGVGDCMQKSFLLLSMLNALDIKAKICLVDTDGEEPYKSDHVVVKIITEDSYGIEKVLIVDPTTGSALSYGVLFVEYDFEKTISKFKKMVVSSHYSEIEY
ncbi:MAG: transglutaminase-like domain-containing protein [candidate division WOR-3 bacterium]